MHKNLLKMNKISPRELSCMSVDYEFLLLLFILVFVNYRKGEIRFMERKVILKNTFQKSLNKTLIANWKDKQNGSLKNSIFVLYRHCFHSWHLIFHVHKENACYSRVRQRSMLNVLLGTGQTQFNKKRIDPLS